MRITSFECVGKWANTWQTTLPDIGIGLKYVAIIYRKINYLLRQFIHSYDISIYK